MRHASCIPVRHAEFHVAFGCIVLGGRIQMKYAWCDFNLYDYYIYDAVWEDRDPESEDKSPPSKLIII